MEHVLRLLVRHGFTETVVTLQFLASLVRNHFGDGEDLGLSLRYATEETPLGTAGSVKNAEHLLRDDTFVVISGDALTDFDLTDLVKFHHDKGALVTVCLTRVPDPLEFGITIVDDDNRVQRFLEKPTWGQVFSDTVNTGIYVMEPEVFDHVAVGEQVDWSGDVFPALLEAGLPVYGYVAEGYWEDVGTHESYIRAQADVLNGQVDVDLDAFEVSSGVWVAEGADVHPDAVLRGPLYIGDYAKVEAGAELREFTVLGSNVIVKSGAFLHRAVVHDNVFIGPQTNLRACVIGKNTDVMRGARVEEGAVIGDECVIEEEAIVSAGVRVYPYKNVEAGAVVSSDRHLRVAQPAPPVRAARGQRHRQRRDHAGAGGPAGQRLGDHPEEGLDRHDVPRRVTGRAGAQAGRHLRAVVQRDRRRRPRGGARAGGPAAHRPDQRVGRRPDPHVAGADRERRHHLPGRRGRRPVAGRPAQAGAHLLPRRVPARVPR